MVTSEDVAKAVKGCVLQAAVTLRPDVRAALELALASENSQRGREALRQLLENAQVAERDSVPLCQDTGTVWVLLELGSEEALGGDLVAEVNGAVAEAYREGKLRMSLAKDALLDRSNTGDNTPAFIDVALRPGSGARVTVMLKGGGSDNASALAMLRPADGWAGVKRFVVETVKEKVASACPPVVVGVGIGATFDKVAGLAKRALLREVGAAAADERLASFESELLSEINALGIGPGGLGGTTTALAVHIATAPSHIAALPVAVNVGCSAVRSCSVEIA